MGGNAPLCKRADLWVTGEWGGNMTPEERYEQNEKLIFFALNKYFPTLVGNEDYQQIARMALWAACKAYKEERGTAFSTYAVSAIHKHVGHILNRFHNRNTFHASALPLDARIGWEDESTWLSTIPDERDEIDAFERAEDARQAMEKIYAVITPKQRRILDALVENDFHLKNTGAALGITGQAVRSSLNSIRRRVERSEH